MDKQVAESSYFRAQQLSKRILEFIRIKEAEFSVRTRYNRYGSHLPGRDAIAAVLHDEQLDALTLTFLMKDLGRTSACQLLSIALLDWLMEMRSPLLCKKLFDATLTVCSAHYESENALRILGGMPKFKVTPDLTSYNLVLTCLSHAGRMDAVQQLLRDMKAAGVKPNEYTTQMVLQTCNFKKNGKYREAIDAIVELKGAGAGIPRDLTNALLAICESAMDKTSDLDEALSIFHELKPMQLCDSTRIYNACIRACARKGQWQTARTYFDDMRKDGVEPDTGSYGALIKACLNGCALDHALDVYEWMVSGRSVYDPIPADIDTYNTLIQACHQAGNLEKALEIMSWVGGSGVAFDRQTYDSLINTVEIAQIWDKKAIANATSTSLAAFPEHLRPAPCDEMRMLYLQHLHVLEEEEILANIKLNAPSWAPASLTSGSSHSQQAPSAANRRAGIVPPYSPLKLSRVPNLMGLSMDTAMGRLPPVNVDGEDSMTPWLESAGSGTWTRGGGLSPYSPNSPFRSPGQRRDPSIFSLDALPALKPDPASGAHASPTRLGSGNQHNQHGSGSNNNMGLSQGRRLQPLGSPAAAHRVPSAGLA